MQQILSSNTVNLDPIIVPDNVLHSDTATLVRLAEARRAILASIASGRIRFVIAGGVKFRLERWDPKEVET